MAGCDGGGTRQGCTWSAGASVWAGARDDTDAGAGHRIKLNSLFTEQAIRASPHPFHAAPAPGVMKSPNMSPLSALSRLVSSCLSMPSTLLAFSLKCFSFSSTTWWPSHARSSSLTSLRGKEGRGEGRGG